ncbi:MAG TPA: LysR family transcriptional regulator [Burkholderiaceae bacterium]|nr:LysR family transcriptional regulator [Burkholderiaceae bacterium]
MNLRFVEAFLWIAQLGSFSAAAARMHATPAAISDRIRTLEEDLGVRLFERDSRRVVLTAEGQRLLPYAEQLLALRDAMKESVRGPSEPSGVISLGVVETAVHTWLPALLRELARVHPGIAVELHSESTPQLKQQLSAGHLSLAVMADEMDSDMFESIALTTDPMIWVACPELARGVDGAKAFEDLLTRQPVMTFMRETQAYRDVRRAVSSPIGVRVSPFSSIAAIVSVLREGHGVAALPSRVVQPHLHSQHLVEIRCGPKLAPLRLVLARAASGRQPVVDAVADLIMRISTLPESAAA